jgi:hypothetical protein
VVVRTAASDTSTTGRNAAKAHCLFLLLVLLLLAAAPSGASADGPAAEEEPKKSLLQSLDRLDRAKVLSALAGLIILGLGMLALVWLGARITHRYMNSSTRYQPPLRTDADLDDWARKPLVEPPEKKRMKDEG